MSLDDASSGLMVYLPFDEGYGYIAYDKSGNGRNAQLFGAVWVNGRYGKALGCDGVDDYAMVSLPQAPKLYYMWLNSRTPVFGCGNGLCFQADRRVRFSGSVTAAAGDLIAPHLCDWSFDGVNDGLHNTGIAGLLGKDQVTLAARVYIFSYKPNPWFSKPFIYGTNRPAPAYWTALEACTNNDYEVREVIASVNYYRSSDNTVQTLSRNVIGYILERWGTLVLTGSHSPGIARIYANNVKLAEMDMSAYVAQGFYLPTYYSDAQKLSVGFNPSCTEHTRMMGSYIALFDLLADDAFVSNLLSYTMPKPAVLWDPTFFDGSKYIDLSGNNNHGTPYGDVARVEAGNKWLWRVTDKYADGKVHVLIPQFCDYVIRDEDENVLAEGYSGDEILDMAFEYEGELNVSLETFAPYPDVAYPIYINGGSLVLGRNPTGRYVQCAIDEFRAYSRVLSSQEIITLMESYPVWAKVGFPIKIEQVKAEVPLSIFRPAYKYWPAEIKVYRREKTAIEAYLPIWTENIYKYAAKNVNGKTVEYLKPCRDYIMYNGRKIRLLPCEG